LKVSHEFTVTDRVGEAITKPKSAADGLQRLAMANASRRDVTGRMEWSQTGPS
jgi:hypothetical protein